MERESGQPGTAGSNRCVAYFGGSGLRDRRIVQDVCWIGIGCGSAIVGTDDYVASAEAPVYSYRTYIFPEFTLPRHAGGIPWREEARICRTPLVARLALGRLRTTL